MLSYGNQVRLITNGCVNDHSAEREPLSGRAVWLGGCVVLLLAALMVWSAAGATPKRVVLMHSYGYGFEPYDTFSETFRTELAKQLGQPVEFHNEALESDRQQGEAS